MLGHETLAEATPQENIPMRNRSRRSSVHINQKVTRLGVMVDDVDGVNVLETVKDLINKKPEMSVRVTVGIGSE